MAKKWITVTEYARAHQVTPQLISRYANDSKIPTNGKTGPLRRVDASAPLPGADRRDEGGAMAAARLAKLEKEIALYDQKITVNRRQMMRDSCAVFLAAIRVSFAPMKQKLLSLKLNQEQTEALRRILEECLQALEPEIEKGLNDDSDHSE